MVKNHEQTFIIFNFKASVLSQQDEGVSGGSHPQITRITRKLSNSARKSIFMHLQPSMKTSINKNECITIFREVSRGRTLMEKILIEYHNSLRWHEFCKCM